MDKIAITKATLSNNNVTSKETIIVKVFAYSITPEAVVKRLPFKMKGGKIFT